MYERFLRKRSNFKEINFEGRGEAYVEQKFITPLLECLGYDLDSDFEVKRHGDKGCSFKLSYPPVENGAKKVKHYNPDFIPTLRKKMFWVIEAKSPSVKHPFEKKYITQGLQYCIHPEIQASYLVITNGKQTSVYDAQNSVFFESDIYKPIFEFKNTEIESQWKSICSLLSAEKIKNILEKKLKELYEKLSLTSLNERYPEILLKYIEQDKFEIREKIKRNLAHRYVDEHEKDVESNNKRMESLPTYALEVYMDHPISGWGRKASEIFLERKIKEQKEEKIFQECVETYEYASIFRKEHYYIMLSTLHNLSKNETLKENIKEFLLDNAFKKLNLLNYVEGLGVRVLRKFIVINYYTSLNEEILTYFDVLPEIIKFGKTPRPIDFTYPYELLCHDKFFSDISKKSEKELHDIRIPLEELEDNMQDIFEKAVKKIPNKDLELYGLETTGAYGFIPSLKHITCNKGVFEYEYMDKLSEKFRKVVRKNDRIHSS